MYASLHPDSNIEVVVQMTFTNCFAHQLIMYTLVLVLILKPEILIIILMIATLIKVPIMYCSYAVHQRFQG